MQSLQKTDAGEGAGQHVVAHPLGRAAVRQFRAMPQGCRQSPHAVVGEPSSQLPLRFPLSACPFVPWTFPSTSACNDSACTTTPSNVPFILPPPCCPWPQRGSSYGSLMTAHGKYQIFANTGHFKVNSHPLILVPTISSCLILIFHLFL